MPYHLPDLGDQQERDWIEFLKNEILKQQLSQNLNLDIRKRRLEYTPNQDFSAIIDPHKLNLRGRLGNTNLDGTYRFDGSYDMGASNPFLGGNLSLRYSQQPENRNLRLQYQRNF